MMAEELKPPRKKWRSSKGAGHPFPVLVESVTGIPAHLAVWKTFSGRFSGDCVHVNKPEDMATLYNMGYFGKGSLSRSCPRLTKVNLVPEIIRERQWKQRLEWNQSLAQENEKQKSEVHYHSAELETGNINKETVPESSVNQDLPSSCHSEFGTRGNHIEASSDNKEKEMEGIGSKKPVIIIPDAIPYCEDFLSQLNPRLEENSLTPGEVLVLSLEEAVFLNYGLGCLQVQDILGEQELSTTELWKLCQETNPRFIERYVVYHYFRSRNWVVKSGLKFGGDFLLYKKGPGVYHASYIVLAKVVKEGGGMWSADCSMKWISLMGMNRLAEASGKEVLICHVIWPSDLPYGPVPTPNVLSKFKVHESILRRWQSSVARITTNSEINNLE